MDRWGIAGQGIETIYSGKMQNVPDVSHPDVEPSRNDPKFDELDRIGPQHDAQEMQVEPSGVFKPKKSSRTYIIDRQDVMEILAKKKKDQDENADAAEMSSSGNAKPSKRLLKHVQTFALVLCWLSLQSKAYMEIEAGETGKVVLNLMG
eukprot:gene4448-5043_t